MHRRILLAAMAVLLILGAPPAVAAPPDEIAAPFPFTAPDVEHELVIFVNTTRAEFCTPAQVAFEHAVAEWLAGGMVGPFPEDPTPPPMGRVAFPAFLVDTPQGVIANTRGTVTGLAMELWTLDDPGDRVGVGACLDTDDTMDLFASGTSTFRGVVTDFFGAAFAGTTRRPRFVDHTQGGGVVTTPDGERYHYSWFFHQHIPCEDDDPNPTCEVAHFRLRPVR